MRIRMLVGFLVGCLLVGSPSRADPGGIAVKVDRRVELMSILFRLAGNPEYNMANSRSAYAQDVEAHFGKFKDHPTVALARELRRTRGISYDAVMSFAVHLDDQMPPGPRTPLQPRPTLLESRWTDADAARFLDALQVFVKETDAARFFDDHAAQYDRCAQKLSAVVNRQQIVPFFDGYFGKRQTASYTVIVGMLCGGGNYGVAMRHADGTEEISPVIGIYRWDREGLPAIGDEVLETVFHEFCHAYTNAYVDQQWAALEKASGALFARNEAAMRRRAYAMPRTLAYESLVRACVVRAIAHLNGEPAGVAQSASEACGGFPWTIRLAAELKKYEADRKTYPSFDDFMPQIIRCLDSIVGDYDAMLRSFPQVVSVSPANGAASVDPAQTAELIITFDRPMRDQSWSVVTLDASQFPQIRQPAYDAARTTLRCPIKLEAGRTYRFGLNGPGFTGFIADDGYPLLPVEVTFKATP